MFFLKKSIKAAVIQSLILQGEKEKNMQSSFTLLENALVHRPQLICLTQAFASGVNFIILKKMAEPVPDGNVANKLAELAARHKVHIAAGILEQGVTGSIYDCQVLFSPKGDLLAKYRRWSLWHGERNYISQGQKIDAVETELGKVGLMVGYDMCFPEAVNHYALQEIDMLICAGSLFQDLGHNVRHLCSARAMDFHCYLLFASAIGEHQFANMKYMGHSAITCDPYFMTARKIIKRSEPGISVLAQANTKEDVIVADLYLDELAKSRKQLPFYQDLSAMVGHAVNG